MRKLFTIIISAIFVAALSTAAFSQTTAFACQGELQDSGIAANGTYQFQFKVYDATSADSRSAICSGEVN